MTHAEEIAAITAERDAARKSALYWKADNTHRARLMTRMRAQLVDIATEIEDGTGRAYFGSTNDADTFRDFVEALDDLAWERIIFDAGERDYIAEIAGVRKELAEAPGKFQRGVAAWMLECFGPSISADKVERNHRFLEEALELVQAAGCTEEEARQLVAYTYSRPVGHAPQEVGGVMVTLAALCLANQMDMHHEGDTELARVWTKVEQIRAKQASKPKFGPLPGVTS